MTTTNSPYLATNNLHFKPICARLGRGLTWTTTALQQNASKTEWHGRVVIILSKALLFVGAVICIPIALIEAVSLFVIGGLAIAVNKFLMQNRSEFLQKHSLKALSYAIHSSAVTVVLFILGLRNPDLKLHTSNAIVDNALHLGSAGFTQCFFGSPIDIAAGRDPRSAITRTINLLSDSHPDVINDIFTQIQRDFDLHLRDRLGQIPNLEQYLNRNPQDREFIQNFNFQTLINDRAYRQRGAELLSRFLRETGVIRPAANQANPLFFDLNQNTVDEAAYQDRLANLLKNSFVEIHRTPVLSHCLDKDGNTGPDLLEMLDAATYVPLTTYTQYKELLEPIQCPDRFAGNLTRYNQRRGQLLAAKARVDALSAAEKQNLVQKILRGSDFRAEGAVQQAYLLISQLAPALYQGPLMTKTALDLQSLDAANVISVRNLFQKACQDAIAELNAQPPV